MNRKKKKTHCWVGTWESLIYQVGETLCHQKNSNNLKLVSTFFSCEGSAEYVLAPFIYARLLVYSMNKVLCLCSVLLFVVFDLYRNSKVENPFLLDLLSFNLQYVLF